MPPLQPFEASNMAHGADSWGGKRRKSIGYAYATSQTAGELGHAETGCYFIQSETLTEAGYWSTPSVWPGSEGEASPEYENEALQALYAEIDAPVSRFCISLHRAKAKA